MKKIHVYLFVLAAMMTAWSCEEESNMDPVGNWTLSDPVLTTPSAPGALDLRDEAPESAVMVSWTRAETSNRFIVAYRVLLVPADDNAFEDPIMELVPANGGKALEVTTTEKAIDYALWARCYPAGQTVNLKWVVIAKAIEKQAIASVPVTVTRFNNEYKHNTLYVTGAATEAGADAADATPMYAYKDADGAFTGVYDVYTTLTAGATYHFRDQASATSRVYGGANGRIAACGEPIAAPETGVYRIRVDLTGNSYTLTKIEHIGAIGGAFQGGWDSDEELEYKGDGVWEAKINFVSESNFIFRANSAWDLIIKPVSGTITDGGKKARVIVESEKDAAGVAVEDAKIEGTGMHTVTLDLSAGAHRLTIVSDAPVNTTAVIGKSANPDADAVSGNFAFGTYVAPETLYLISDGAQVAELTKSATGASFTSRWLALEKSKTYTLNSAPDGTGTTYNNIGNGEIAVDRDQAYTLTVDFTNGRVSWKYYNLKLFHWNNDGGWDARNEYALTYVHPYKFVGTGLALTGGYHMKVFSPWEVEFSSEETTLSGTMQRGVSTNFQGITQSGTYDATFTVADDYQTLGYAFVKK